MAFVVIGNYVSPYVRKVLVCMELKGLDYAIDPIAPFVGNAAFERLSPLRRIPVLLADGRVFNDSSVICQYLEDTHPQPALYPADKADRAQARWLEEYADTALADALIWRLFYQQAIRRHVFGEATDEAVVREALEVHIPRALDYLETQLPAEGFLFGALSIADIAIACMFRTAAFVRYAIDRARWPRSAHSWSACWRCHRSASWPRWRMRCCASRWPDNAPRWPPRARHSRRRAWAMRRHGAGFPAVERSRKRWDPLALNPTYRALW